MFSKIIQHLRDGDLLTVAGNYIQNITVRHKIEEWRKIKASGNPVEISLGKNSRFRLYPDSILSEPIYTGRFEIAEIDFVRSCLKAGDTFIDVGANVGLFTVIAAECVGNTGKVFSFEPVNKTYSRLEENVKLNGFKNVVLTKAGLSDQDGSLNMVTSSDGYDAWNSFGKPTAGSDFITENVMIKKFQTWMDQVKPGVINLMKIDVEGWEIPVIKGGYDFFSGTGAPDLLVEFTEENCVNAGFTCRQLYSLIAEAGYKMFTYDRNKRKLIPEPKRDAYTHMNIIATKNVDALVSRIKS